MENFIDHISVKNFKSIKSCELSDCKRINLFIGRPNVGKSNIIEALSLLSVPFLSGGRKLTELIRFENAPELFSDGESENYAQIDTNIGNCKLTYDENNGLTIELEYITDTLTNVPELDRLALMMKMKMEVNNGQVVQFVRDFNRQIEFPVKRYHYKSVPTDSLQAKSKYLMSPFGDNLYSILRNSEKQRMEIGALFAEYKMKLTMDTVTKTVKILKDVGENNVFLLPYSSVSDTLLRLIFFKTAIASNENSVLLFEEPEAHAFPPYMVHITQEIIKKKSNQYFIATHSPFVLNDLLENAIDELAVFNVGYTDGQTTIRRLTDMELHEVLQYGVDLFTNNESYI